MQNLFNAVFDQLEIGLQKAINPSGQIREQYKFPELNIPENQKMKFCGWISTRDKDFQGETVEPSLMNLSYVSQNGMPFKWEHGLPYSANADSKTALMMPGAVVATATEVSKFDYGVLAKGEMYYDPDPASVISLARKSLMLNEQGGSPAVKLSVEGTYGKSFPNGLRETIPTGCVFTYNPVNPKSLVALYKSMLPTYQTDPAQMTGLDALQSPFTGDKDKLIKSVGKSLYTELCGLANETTILNILAKLLDNRVIISKSMLDQLTYNIKQAREMIS